MFCPHCGKEIVEQKPSEDKASLAYKSSKEIVKQLYLKILNRDADVGGLKHYSEQLDAGIIDVDRLEQVLLESDEYKNKQTVVEDLDINDQVIKL